MEQLLSGYLVYALSFLLIFISLATILYLQFSVAGIVNFGVVGFWGLGMYSFSILLVTFEIPFIIALVVACAITGLVSWLLGLIVLDLDGQSILVGTLAFATIIEYLTTTEKWLTNGVVGFGTVSIPFNFGNNSSLVYLIFILIVTSAVLLYAYQLKRAPYGRLLLSIKDNEVLSQSLGKPTFRHKVIFFTVTCTLLGLIGAMSAPLYSYLFPRMIGPGITFTIWIALMLGGKSRLMGGLVGILVTIGLFDYIIESVVPIPTIYASIIPNAKFALYGLTLMLILMFRPSGILGEKKRGVRR